MSFKKNFIICALLVVMLMCGVSAVSASDDSSNDTLTSDEIEEIVTTTDVCDVSASDSSSDKLGDGDNDIIYVDSNYVGENETGTADNPYKTISGAVNGATKNKSTVFIKNGNYSENSISLPGDKEFSFIGESENGVVVTSMAKLRSFFLTSQLSDSSLSLINITFKNNDRGQALKVSGSGNFNIINCTWNKFTAISQMDATFVISTDTSTIKNCKIINSDTAQTSSGFLRYTRGNHVIEDLIINKGSGADFNEGIIRIDANAIVKAQNLTISNFSAAASKGVMQVSGKANIKNAKFLNNNFYTDTFSRTCYSLIYVNNGNLTMESTVASDNSGFNYVIYENGANSYVTINNTVFNNNNYKVDLLNAAGTNNIDYNWWGTNDKPNDVIDKWVIMNSTLLKNIDEVTLTVDFTKYTDGNNIHDLEKLLPEFPVNFKSSNLTVSDNVYTKNGIASIKFISNGDFYIDINVGKTVTLNLGDIYVDSNFNGTEIGTIDNPFRSISKAANSATGWETIHIKNGNYTENNPITLINSLTFIGESEDGVIITGGSRGLFNNPFYMSKNIVLSFNNLNIKDMACTGNNAPMTIGSSVSKLEIINCVFDNCTSKFGPINIASSNAIIDNCKVLNSRSSETGAINFNNNGTYEIKNLVIENITYFEDNMEGIIICKDKGAVLTLDNVQITNIYNSSSVLNLNSKFSIKNSKISKACLINSKDMPNAILYMGNGSDGDIRSITISDISSSAIFHANGSKITVISSSISNINCTNVFDFVGGTVVIIGESVRNGVSVAISNINCSNVFSVDNSSVFMTFSSINNIQCSEMVHVGDGSNITLDQCLISNNKISNILFNNSESSNVVANFIAFVNNDYSELINKDTNYDLDFNWWGTNDKPNEFVNSWVIMTAAATKRAGSVNLYIYFNKASNGERIFDLEKDTPQGIPVSIVTSTGDYNATLISGGQSHGSHEVRANFALGENTYVNITSKEANIVLSLEPKSIYVDSKFNGTELGTKDNPYITINSAIKNAQDRDKIFIKNGVYSLDDVWSSKTSLDLIGESRGNVIIDCVNARGIYFKGGSTTVHFTNLTFTSSVATIISFSSVSAGSYDIDLVNISFENFTIKSGSSSYLLQFAKSGVLKNVSMNNIKSSGTVGGIINSKSGTTVEIDNLTICNSVGTFGKGMVYDEGRTIIINSNFINNTVDLSVKNYAMFYRGTIKNSNFINNIVKRQFMFRDTVVESSFIYNNTGSLNQGSAVLNKNWWGTNSPTGVTNWIILDAYFTPERSVAGDLVNITATFNRYMDKDGNIFDLEQGCIPDGILVTFTLPDGENVTAITKDGKAMTSYTLAEAGNDFVIKANDAVIYYTAVPKTLRIDLADNYTATEDANITILAPGINATVDLIIDGKKETIDIVNGTAVKTIENITAGTHSAVVIYNDNGKFDFDSKSFTVDKLQTQISLEDVTVNVGQTVPVEFTIASDATGRVFIDINGKKSFGYLNDGSLSMDLDLEIGNYTVTVSYEGNDKYLPSEDSFRVTVNAFDANLKANITSDNIKVGETADFNIEINPEVTGNVIITIGDAVYPVTFTEGKATVSISDLANGTYTAVIKFAGDDKFLADEVNVTFTVTKEEIPSNINVSMDIPEGTTAPEFTINLPKDATGNFTVTVDGNNYTAPLVNGSATVKVPELAVGNHTISSSYSGDKKYDGFTSAAQTVEIPKASIPGGEDALNMTTPSDSANPSFSINLPKDATGNLTVTVDGKDTYTQALVNGSATVDVPKLSEGKHNITVTYTGDDKYSSISKNTTVAVPVIKLSKNNNISMLYSAGTKYKVLVTVDGKAKAGVKVTFKFNGKTKAVTTDKNGYATYKIPTVKPKKAKYTITASYGGKTVKNTVKVNSIIKASNKNVKKSKKVTKVKITLKKVNKKYLKGKTLKIKFNKKTYKVKTNKKGTATWNVKKSMLQKLKVGKKYSYKVTYGKDVVTKKLTIKK